MDEDIQSDETAPAPAKPKKEPKRGIIYLSTIPPYMNVTRIREYFSEFGPIGRVYLQLSDRVTKTKDGKISKRKIPKRFSEGWVEFERKSTAKKVAASLNNTQVSNRKKSKQYDYLWNIKYLSGFKWTHLHERLAYEKAVRRQKMRAEVQVAKRTSDFFNANLNKKKNKEYKNKEYENIQLEVKTSASMSNETVEDRDDFLRSLFG